MWTFLGHVLVMMLSTAPLIAWYRYLTIDAGRLVLSTASFVAFGAYLSMAFSKFYGVPSTLSLLIAAAAGGVLGTTLGIMLLRRVANDFLALATLALAQVVYVFLRTAAPGGAGGMGGVPQLLAAASAPRLMIDLMLALVLCVLLLAPLAWMRRSQFGALVLAAKDEPAAVESLGFDVVWIHGQVFGATALVAALVGAFQAHYLGSVEPGLAGMTSAVLLLTAALLARPHVLVGAFLGASFVVAVPEAIQLTFRLWFDRAPWVLFPIMQLVSGMLVIVLSALAFSRIAFGERRADA